MDPTVPAIGCRSYLFERVCIRDKLEERRDFPRDYKQIAFSRNPFENGKQFRSASLNGDHAKLWITPAESFIESVLERINTTM